MKNKLRLIINWLALITMPVWAGTIILLFSLLEIYYNTVYRKIQSEKYIKGEAWFWE